MYCSLVETLVVLFECNFIFLFILTLLWMKLIKFSYENARNQLLTNLKWLMHIRSLLTTYFRPSVCLTTILCLRGKNHEMTIKSWFVIIFLYQFCILQSTLISFVAQGCVGSGQSWVQLPLQTRQKLRIQRSLKIAASENRFGWCGLVFLTQMDKTLMEI